MTPAGNPGPEYRWPVELLASVRHLPPHSTLFVALSGGLDSVLLLHAVVRQYPQRERLAAIHINHQLQDNAAETDAFCERLCGSLGVRFLGIKVDVPANQPEAETGTGGLEEAARDARYQAFDDCLGKNDLLLLAHHQDDQLETLLFRMFRGSGVAGLAGMPMSRPLGQGSLYRPLLRFSRSQLEAWASELKLDWMEDPSNQDSRFDRNFLRNRIIPALKERWPSLNQRLLATSSACKESAELNDRLAQLQFRECRTEEGDLNLDALSSLSIVEQKNIIRWWVSQHRLPAPNPADWPQLLAEFQSSGPDRQPEFRGQGYTLRRHQNHLCLITGPLVAGRDEALLPVNGKIVWGSWRLALSPVSGNYDAPPKLKVACRGGGERVRTNSDGPSKSLKNWLQEQKVPAWDRNALPLIFDLDSPGPELVAVGDLWVSQKYCGEAPASGWRLIVERDSN
ncbi:tRNA lysidine(34) synthetase TilS [Marinobacter sp. CHS3-4]|uniref:tRNA lysidine(34) synthetase TilS n=1 Tax=Marinobacter sp. CHS3-4 TaxID=3045174 RepID=UPI0024B4F61D|nr:tRNA lysidine(34) synthetase TilS [Marinobacter sp. CHS3-4]MDI9246824.1 tRNA lysidine(34) synthetase TilS [Marinobacter sp. CHS3-4]